MIQHFNPSSHRLLVPRGSSTSLKLEFGAVRAPHRRFRTRTGRYTDSSHGTQKLCRVPQGRAGGGRRARRTEWRLTRANESRAIQTRGSRPEIPRMGLARHRAGPHHLAGAHTARHRRPSNRGPHRGNQPLLLECDRRPGPPDAGFGERCSCPRGFARFPRLIAHGVDSGPWRCRNRGSCRS